MYPFKDGSYAVRNGWHVAAFTNELGRELLARNILGKPVVLYRKEDGTAVAVGGRCAHRHFPLGKKQPAGRYDRLRLSWFHFGPDGQCVDIPSQAHVPKACRIPTYPLIEHGMWAWIWMGEPDLADPALSPDLHEIGFCSPNDVQRPICVHQLDWRYQLLNDNLTDLSHLAFLHGTSIGTRENASEPQEMVKRDRFISSRRNMKNVSIPPLLKETRALDGDLIDRVTSIDFYAPSLHVAISDTRYPEDHPRKPGEQIVSARVYHAVTPSTARSSLYFFGVAAPDKAEVDMLEIRLKPVLNEDIFASIEIEKIVDLCDGSPPAEFMVKSDTNAVACRRMLQRMMDEVQAAEEMQNG